MSTTNIPKLRFCADEPENPVADAARAILLGQSEGSATSTGLVVDNETANSLGNTVSANSLSQMENKKFA